MKFIISYKDKIVFYYPWFLIMNKIAFYRIVFKLLRYEFDWEIFKYREKILKFTFFDFKDFYPIIHDSNIIIFFLKLK